MPSKITQAQIDERNAAHAAAKRRSEIMAELDELDRDSVRALRAKGVGRGKPADTDRLAQLDDRAQVLRDELAAL